MSKKIKITKELLAEKLERQSPILYNELVDAKQEDLPDFFVGSSWEKLSSVLHETITFVMMKYSRELVDNLKESIEPFFPELWTFIEKRNQFLNKLPDIFESYPKAVSRGDANRAWEVDLETFGSADIYAGYLKTEIKEYLYLIPKIKNINQTSYIPYYRMIQLCFYLNMALHCEANRTMH